MTSTTQGLDALVGRAFDRRTAPLEALAAQAGPLALACRDMAARFSAGGRLLVFGNGASATDAQHVAVEFVHPVIVGKRALPALALVGDTATLLGVASRVGLDEVFAHQLRVLARPADIALGLSSDGDCADVRRGLEQARAAGLLTVALVGGDGGAIGRETAAEHCLLVPSDDPQVVKEGHVTAYHLLWELVHVFFDAPQVRPDAPVGVEQLYPFLYGGADQGADVLAQVADSSEHKLAEIVQLREQVGRAQGNALATCAGELAEAFAAGATLLAFGNGGSSTDAQDVVHTFLDPADGDQPLPALCLTNDAAVVTALSNDIGFEVVFARQLRAFGRSGDIALGISTSGGSANVLAAFDEAKRVGMLTVGLSGYSGGPMAQLASLDHLFAVPSSSVHRVQEVQTTLYHVLWEATRAALATA
jgi:D-sedoheptulose 7-phosphate isomerase